MSTNNPFDEPDELDDIEEQADIVGKLTPREYAKIRGMAPQMVYYYIRNGVIDVERCICGRKVIDVKQADDRLQKKAEARSSKLETGDIIPTFD